jgi:hypothetical protein
MPYTQAIIPLRGWITDTVYSGVPEGYTHDILNMIPMDPFRRKVRLGTRPGFNRAYKFASGAVQCLVRTSAFNGSPPVIKDRVFIVNAGKIYFLDPGDTSPTQVAQVTTGSLGAALQTSGRVEAVQRGQYCYFVDGLNYRRVDLFASPPVWSAWEHASHGPEDNVTNTVGGVAYTATIIALFGTRLVLAGVRQKENIWWMSDINDPDDWSGATGADEAIAGNTGIWGVPGDEIVALIPFGQGAIIFAGRRSMSMLTADPVFGNATIQQMSRTVGIVGPRAWCNGPEKTVYVMAQDGLYRLTPNDFNIDRGQLVSLNKLDSFFNATKWEDIDCTLSYDVERRGLWIFLTRTDQPDSSTHLFYSDQTDGFFPYKMYDPTFRGAYSTCQMLTTDGRNQVALFGSLNGQIGFFDQKIIAGIDGYPAAGYTSTISTGEAIAQRIETRVSIGPMVSSQPGLAFCNEVQIELGADQYLPDEAVKGNAPNPTASLLSAETAQEAIAESINSVFVSDVLSILADGGNAGLTNPDGSPDPQSPTYDGGGASPTIVGYLDGQYARTTVGTYTTQDTFVKPLSRVYEDSDSRYELVRDTFGGFDRWGIRFQDGGRPVFVQQQVNGEYAEDPAVGEYRYVVTDESGTIIATLSNVTANVAATAFESSTVTNLGNLVEGENNRMKCRVRANAIFLRLSSSGYPFALERIGASLAPVGPRRTVVDVS